MKRYRAMNTRHIRRCIDSAMNRIERGAREKARDGRIMYERTVDLEGDRDEIDRCMTSRGDNADACKRRQLKAAEDAKSMHYAVITVSIRIARCVAVVLLTEMQLTRMSHVSASLRIDRMSAEVESNDARSRL
jgi:hypothetical protein